MACGYHIGRHRIVDVDLHSRVATASDGGIEISSLSPFFSEKHVHFSTEEWAGGPKHVQDSAPSPTVDFGLWPSQNEVLPTQTPTFIFQVARAEFPKGSLTINDSPWFQHELFRKGRG